jgi:hypothetical protein
VEAVYVDNGATSYEAKVAKKLDEIFGGVK